jgi:hypothetical protein
VAARLAAEAFRGEAAKGGSEGRGRKQSSEAGRRRRRKRTAQVTGAKLVHLESGGAGKGGMRTRRREDELRRAGLDDRSRRSGQARWGRGHRRRRRRRQGRPPLPRCAGGTLEQSPTAANLAQWGSSSKSRCGRRPAAAGLARQVPGEKAQSLGLLRRHGLGPPSRPAPRPTPPPPSPHSPAAAEAALPRRPSAWAQKCAAASRSPGLRGSARAHLSRAPSRAPRRPPVRRARVAAPRSTRRSWGPARRRTWLEWGGHR